MDSSFLMLGIYLGCVLGWALCWTTSKYLARRANMVQPLVGPPDAGRLSEEPAALARRLTLSEVKTFIEDEIAGIKVLAPNWITKDMAVGHLRNILQHLEKTVGTEGQDAP